MEKRRGVVALALIFCAIFLSGCNDGGKIWEEYRKESFRTLISYEREGVTVCARVSVVRSEAGDEITAEFSAPEALRGAIGRAFGDSAALSCCNLELVGDAAESVMAVPIALAARDAIGFEILRGADGKSVSVAVDGGWLIFDAESRELTGADLCGTECKIISFLRGK